MTNNFEQYLQNKSFAYKSITRHQREIDKYSKWLQINHNQTPEFASKKQLLDYLQHVKKSRKLSNDTQNGILAKLKNYYKYLFEKYDTQNITAFIKIRGLSKKKLQTLFNPDELEILCDFYYYYIQKYEPNPKETRFYPDYSKLLQGKYIALTLIAYQGLKVSEIHKLTKANFDFRKATIKIHASRTGATRTLKLDASQIGIIIQFFAVDDMPIISNLNQLDKLSKALKKLTQKPSTSITKFKDFRQLRASKITHWIKLYGLRKAQYLAGHRYINTTEKYLANNIENLQNDFDNFHPLN